MNSFKNRGLNVRIDPLFLVVNSAMWRAIGVLLRGCGRAYGRVTACVRALPHVCLRLVFCKRPRLCRIEKAGANGVVRAAFNCLPPLSLSFPNPPDRADL